MKEHLNNRRDEVMQMYYQACDRKSRLTDELDAVRKEIDQLRVVIGEINRLGQELARQEAEVAMKDPGTPPTE